MSKIIVGADGSDGSRDALPLASRLAGITGSTLVLANVFPYDVTPSGTLNREFEQHLSRDADATLELLRKTLDANTSVETCKVPNSSAAHGLHALAEREEAGLIVVGSTHTGRAGRVLPGSTGERLLHGAPCPVAVAPKGYADKRGNESRVIGCGYDGSLSSQRALAAAHGIAAATGARLRVIRAFQPLVYDIPPESVAVGDRSTYNDSLQKSASEELHAAVARIDGDAEAIFTVGDPTRTLAEESEQLEFLFVGSRGYGPLHAVVVGGVAGALVREAACPVIVLPRKAGHVEEDSLFAEAASRAAVA